MGGCSTEVKRSAASHEREQSPIRVARIARMAACTAGRRSRGLASTPSLDENFTAPIGTARSYGGSRARARSYTVAGWGPLLRGFVAFHFDRCQERPTLAINASLTVGDTNSVTSPPSVAISLTSVDEMNV